MAELRKTQSDRSNLLLRIEQLESERDELQHNVEKLSSATQSSGFGDFDFVSRIQGRRASSLEHQLEACQTKLVGCKKENTKLQEELAEVYKIKSKFAELLKLEVDKSAGLEKEVKFFQTRAAAALTDRDRCLIEIEKYQSKEDAMTEEVAELQDRLEDISAELGKAKKFCSNLHNDLEEAKLSNKKYEKVIERLWNVREQATGHSDAKHPQDWAEILLLDSEHVWSYGEMNEDLRIELKQAKDELAFIREEFEVCSASLTTVQNQFNAEVLARMEAQERVSACREQMSCLAGHVEFKLEQLMLANTNLKEDTLSVLHKEKEWMESTTELWKHLLDTRSMDKQELELGNVDQEKAVELEECTFQDANKLEIQGIVPDSCCKRWNEASQVLAENGESAEESIVDKFAHSDVVQMQVLEENVDSPCLELPPGLVQDDEDWDLKHAVEYPVYNENEMSADDDRKALAQALQEKVSALILLSQQEERHIFEANTMSALESQATSLKQQLVQVTSEKVNALMELARVHEECMKLQGKRIHSSLYQRTASNGGLLGRSGTAEDINNFLVHPSDNRKKPFYEGYLKHFWLRGPEIISRSRSLSNALSLNRSKEPETSTARLHIENAAFRESLSSIRHLCKLANRLRFTIAKVAAESVDRSEASNHAAEQVVDGVISEALHLKVALHDSTPMNDLGWNSIGSPLTRAQASETGHDGLDEGEVNDDLDIVSFFGLEILRLVLLAAQLQKRCLVQSLQLRT